MRQLISKLTSKYQTTIPKEIREALMLKAKDKVVFEIKDDKTVILHKATPLDLKYLEALNYTLSEWESDEDENAYKDL